MHLCAPLGKPLNPSKHGIGARGVTASYLAVLIEASRIINHYLILSSMAMETSAQGPSYFYVKLNCHEICKPQRGEATNRCPQNFFHHIISDVEKTNTRVPYLLYALHFFCQIGFLHAIGNTWLNPSGLQFCFLVLAKIWEIFLIAAVQSPLRIRTVSEFFC